MKTTTNRDGRCVCGYPVALHFTGTNRKMTCLELAQRVVAAKNDAREALGMLRRRRVLCFGCGAELTAADREAGCCTQCGRELATEGRRFV